MTGRATTWLGMQRTLDWDQKQKGSLGWWQDLQFLTRIVTSWMTGRGRREWSRRGVEESHISAMSKCSMIQMEYFNVSWISFEFLAAVYKNCCPLVFMKCKKLSEFHPTFRQAWSLAKASKQARQRGTDPDSPHCPDQNECPASSCCPSCDSSQMDSMAIENVTCFPTRLFVCSITYSRTKLKTIYFFLCVPAATTTSVHYVFHP